MITWAIRESRGSIPVALVEASGRLAALRGFAKSRGARPMIHHSGSFVPVLTIAGEGFFTAEPHTEESE